LKTSSQLPAPCSLNKDFHRFYPTTALVTAYDILFFWVSRMVMAGLEFTGTVPFRDIYIPGLVRDKQGRKMSKSLGNGIDPLELIDEYGADALKFTLAFLCAQGQDILIDKESFKLGSKFANKVWNASRYILLNLDGRTLVASPPRNDIDRWIYGRLAAAAAAMREAFTSYRYNDAAQKAYEYFWNDFCDWYVEATKLSTRDGGEAEKDRAISVLLDVLSESLRLLHPLLPFVTEEIYAALPNTTGLLITASYPTGQPADIGERETNFSGLQELTRAIRTLRSECGITPEKRLRVEVWADENAAFLQKHESLLKLLSGLADISIIGGRGERRPAGSVALAGAGFEAFVFVSDAVDMAALKQKFGKELDKDKKFTAGLGAKLANEKFLQNAPAELVESEKHKLEEAEARIAKVEAYVTQL
jgi:valyl-tRNA synthetase